jgi:hypothetical protein
MATHPAPPREPFQRIYTNGFPCNQCTPAVLAVSGTEGHPHSTPRCNSHVPGTAPPPTAPSPTRATLPPKSPTPAPAPIASHHPTYRLFFFLFDPPPAGCWDCESAPPTEATDACLGAAGSAALAAACAASSASSATICVARSAVTSLLQLRRRKRLLSSGVCASMGVCECVLVPSQRLPAGLCGPSMACEHGAS